MAEVVKPWRAGRTGTDASVVDELPEGLGDHGVEQTLARDLRSAVDGGSWDMPGRYGQVSGSRLALHRGNA
jgi:hypothetical protein